MASLPLNIPAAGTEPWDAIVNQNWSTINEILAAGPVRYAEAYASVQAAINALPAAGGVVDARSPLVNRTLGNLDPGTKTVCILLGPYTYTMTSCIIRSGLRILGASKNATVIQAGDTVTSPFTLDQTNTVQHVELANFQLQAQTNSSYTQNGISLVISNPSQGLWYSYIHDILIQGQGGAGGFGGVQILFDGSGGGIGAPTVGQHQFISMVDVVAFRKNVAAWVPGIYAPGNTVTINNGTVVAYNGATAYVPGNMVYSGGVTYMCILNSVGNTPPNSTFWLPVTQIQSARTYVCIATTSNTPAEHPLNASFWQPYESYALKFRGCNGQMFFENCEFDGMPGGPGSGINVGVIATSAANFCQAIGITLFGCTMQAAALAVYIAGGFNFHLKDPHFEAVKAGVLVDVNSTAVGTWGLQVDGGYWATNPCQNGGAGYAVAFTPAVVNDADLLFAGNNFFGPPDNTVIGSGSTGIVIKDNGTLVGQSALGPYAGCVPTIAAAASIGAGKTHAIAVNGTTTITTIQTLLGPGEILVVIANGSTVNLGTGGNIGLAGLGSPLAIANGHSATFLVVDLSATTLQLISHT